MKRNLVRFVTVAAMAAGMTFAQTAPAPSNAPQANGQQQGRRGFNHHRGMHQRFMQALNLSADQQQQTKAIFQQARQQEQPIRQQMKQTRQSMAAAVKADNTSQIQSLATQMGSLQGQLIGIRSEAAAKAYRLLTPEQKTKADQLHQERMQRWQQKTGKQSNNS